MQPVTHPGACWERRSRQEGPGTVTRQHPKPIKAAEGCERLLGGRWNGVRVSSVICDTQHDALDVYDVLPHSSILCGGRFTLSPVFSSSKPSSTSLSSRFVSPTYCNADIPPMEPGPKRLVAEHKGASAIMTWKKRNWALTSGPYLSSTEQDRQEMYVHID